MADLAPQQSKLDPFIDLTLPRPILIESANDRISLTKAGAKLYIDPNDLEVVKETLRWVSAVQLQQIEADQAIDLIRDVELNLSRTAQAS